MSIAELSRTVAFRLTLFYSLFFAVCVVMLLGFIYWQTATEMTRRVDQVLTLENIRFGEIAPDRLAAEIDRSIQRDQRHVYFYGLFAPGGQRLTGNVFQLPYGVPVDGYIYDTRLVTDLQPEPLPARALLINIGAGNTLLIGHDVLQLTEFGEITRKTFFWGGSLTILLGLAFGLILSFRPLRRVEQIQQVCELIMRGDIGQRLPVSRHHDELDMLSAIVNRMLDEVERLMSEVKSVGDNIAHDLRTPLTRLRAVLYRMQQQMEGMPAQQAMVEQVIGEVDSLLLRFRALLRISEIENKQRRAGFKQVKLQDILEQAVNFLIPLAEDKLIRLSLTAGSVNPILGDGDLLFEVFVNVLDNAIKFTPAGGRIEVRLAQGERGPQVDIVDSGPGISESERTAVLNRFYRGQNEVQAPGFGLGLSIVMAIIRLHDFGFELAAAKPGTRATVFCWSHGE
ncbi:swarming motility regulation sensor protein RssA [mine drainage metagenome]|uniref:histidine kinase n=1 Tax=mine drainage metagenome TaxID=410659 RepID=A0A1J5TF31_9ZZZZ